MSRLVVLVGAVALAFALYLLFAPTEVSGDPVIEAVRRPMTIDMGTAPELEGETSTTNDRGPLPQEATSQDAPLDWVWYEDEDFLEKARREYSNHLAAVEARVARYAVMDRGAAAIERSLERGASLFLTDEFPLTKEELIGSEEFGNVDIANGLSAMAAGRRNTGRWLADLEPFKRDSAIKAMSERPLDFPPSIVMQSFLSEERPELKPDFVSDAKALYLKTLPRLGAAQRTKGIGMSATWDTLKSLGVEMQPTSEDQFAGFEKLSGEYQSGTTEEGMISNQYLIELRALVSKYYQ